MVFPNRKIVENIRREYPVGTRVELIKMHDKQAPPVGMTGTVLGVDDTASLLMHWDNGSGLNVIYGEDCVKMERQRSGIRGRKQKNFSFRQFWEVKGVNRADT